MNLSILKFQSVFMLLFIGISAQAAQNIVDVPYGYETNVFEHKKCEGWASTFKVIVHRYKSNKLMSRYAIYSYKCNNGKSIDGPGFEKPFTARLDFIETPLPAKNLLSPIELPENLKEDDESLQNYLLMKSKLQAAENQILDCDEYFQSKRSLLDVASESTDLAKQSFDQGEKDEGNVALSISKGLLDLALNFTPGVSWGRDVYEAISGKDLITGEELDYLSRGIATLGVVTVGFGSKIKCIKKIFDGLDHTGVTSKMIKSAFENKSVKEVKEFVEFFKEVGITKADYIIDNITSFTRNSKIEILTKDLNVKRYYSINPKTPSKPRGAWVTTGAVKDPKSELALLVDGPFEVKDWVIPKGTKVARGGITPKFGQTASSIEQIYVNKDFLQ